MHTQLDNNLSVGLCNIQGGLTGLAKTLELQDLLLHEKIDIMGINETNLKSDIDTASLNFPRNFELLRCDRPNDSGRGGSGILLSKNIKYKILDLNITYTDISKIEAIWIHLEESNLNICCFYRSQNFCPLDTFLDYMTECMMKLQGKKVIWIGDVNVNQNCLTDLDYKKLDITMKLFGLIQTVTGITRVANLNGRITQSTIDVVMTNCYSNFIECKVLEDRIGDHQALKCVLDFKVNKATKFQKILIRNHSVNNLKDLRYFLGHCSNYGPIIRCTDVDQATDGLTHHIKTAYDQFCPVKQIKCKSNYLTKPSQELLSEIKKKKLLNRKYRGHVERLNKIKCKCINSVCKCKRGIILRREEIQQTCDSTWELYRRQRNKVTKLSRENRRTNIVKDLTVKSARNDLTGIWKTIKHAANLPSKNVHSCQSSNINADAVNLHFSTVASIIQNNIMTNDTDDPLGYLAPQPECRMLTFEEVTVKQVEDYISSIPSDKSINDLMPMKVYKYIIPEISVPLTHIVNLSMNNGVMPSACKIASVVPIYKSGDTNDRNNYKPISILPLIGKCIEYFVNQQLTSYVEDNDILCNQQYGFRKDHSTTFLMLDLFDKIFKAKESLKRPALVFLDIKKAFDTVNHDVLLKKLKHYGVDGFVIKLFESYLTGGRQVTKLGSTISTLLPINTGVPQGSILGPILFSLFINDLSHNCKNSTAFLFADDSALYFNNVTRGIYANVIEDMKIIHEWFRVNKLSFNATKTSFLVFDRNIDTDIISIQLTSEGQTLNINEVKSQKY